MGCDKALLELSGRPLIEHTLDKLRILGFPARIIGSRPDLAIFTPVIPDNYPRTGPLGGIEAALAASDAEQNLFLPVDLPQLPVEFLRWMIDRVALTNALATIPQLQGRPEPLCAIYNRALLPHAQASLLAGDAKVMHAVERAAGETGLRIDCFDVEPVAAAQSWDQTIPLHHWFQNLNTPADVERAALEQTARIH
jgi:molybdopterin-guanine dinucleotide biosynthesis protein A